MDSIPNEVRDDRPDIARKFHTITHDRIHDTSVKGTPLNEVLREAVEDYKAGLEYAIKNGDTEAEFIEQEGDRAVWDGPRVVAIIRSQPGGTPEVIRLSPGRAMTNRDRVTDIGDPRSTAPDGNPIESVDGGREANGWDLGRIVTEAAILRYRAALAQQERAERLGNQKTWPWEMTAIQAANEAKRQLIAAILLWSPNTDLDGEPCVDDFMRRVQKPWGVRYGSRTYIASPDPEWPISDRPHQDDVMHLVEIDDQGVTCLT